MHLAGHLRGYFFESNCGDTYTPRYIQIVVHEAATQARIEKQVTPHRLRASVATILLDAQMMAAATREMPLGGKRAPMGSGRVRTKQLAIWIDDARFATVSQLAEAESITRTALIERWIDKHSGELPASLPDQAQR